MLATCLCHLIFSSDSTKIHYFREDFLNPQMGLVVEAESKDNNKGNMATTMKVSPQLTTLTHRDDHMLTCSSLEKMAWDLKHDMICDCDYLLLGILTILRGLLRKEQFGLPCGKK